MTTTLAVGAAASICLALGALVGTFAPVSRRLGGLVMAVGAGSLMAAATLDLLAPAVRRAGTVIAAVWFLVGAVVFVLVDGWLDRYADPTDEEWSGDRTYAYLLLAAVVLDGIPENAALGLTGAEGGLGLGVGIALSNLPEAMDGARSARLGGLGPGRVLLVWCGAAAALFVSVLVGIWLRSAGGTVPGPLLSFAAGAVVASIADALIPRAVQRSGTVSALGVALGFLVGVVVSL